MLSSGFGCHSAAHLGIISSSRIYLGLYSQAIIAFDELGTGNITRWGV